MSSYRVNWSIEVEADNPEDAAWEALGIQRDENSTANVFTVTPSDNDPPFSTHVDLGEIAARHDAAKPMKTMVLRISETIRTMVEIDVPADLDRAHLEADPDHPLIVKALPGWTEWEGPYDREVNVLGEGESWLS